ncbi:hypothetical protein HAX54_027514, partial [Datura stramonium]|nr:hypothetical protein [Datura stramonium]
GVDSDRDIHVLYRRGTHSHSSTRPDAYLGYEPLISIYSLRYSPRAQGTHL